MQEDDNIPLLTDLIERGELDENSANKADDTELLGKEQVLRPDSTDLVIEDITEAVDSTELSVEPRQDEPSDRTQIRDYDNVEEEVETGSSSVDFLVEADELPETIELTDLSTAVEPAEELDSELEETIQRILDKHMDQAMHEIRLALQLRKR